MMQRGRSGRCQKSGAEVSFERGRSFFHEGPKLLLKGTEVSYARGRSVFSRGAEVSFRKGAEGAEVVWAEVSNPHHDVIQFMFSTNSHMTEPG